MPNGINHSRSANHKNLDRLYLVLLTASFQLLWIRIHCCANILLTSFARTNQKHSGSATNGCSSIQKTQPPFGQKAWTAFKHSTKRSSMDVRLDCISDAVRRSTAIVFPVRPKNTPSASSV